METSTSYRRSRRLVRIASVLTLAVALLTGCSGTTGSSGGDDGGNDNDDSRSDAPMTCPSGCPDGQYCFNGACVVGCNSNDDCAEDQYCATETDRLCHNKEVPECSSDGDCKGDQVCTQGLCAAEPDTSDDECEPSPDGKDGCGKYAVCVEENSGNTCYTLPRCGADDSCPTGNSGAVCNEGYIPNKAEICLLGLCKDGGDCPGEWTCSRGVESQTLGYCRPGGGGGSGTMCREDSDCESGNCQGATATTPGVCE